MFGISILDIITVLSAIAAFVTIIAVYNSTVARDPMRGRIKHLQSRREALRAGFVAPVKRKRAGARLDGVGYMRNIVGKLKLLQTDQTKKTVKKLAQAGFRNKDAVVVFLFFKLVLPAVTAITAIVLVYGLGVLADNQLWQMLLSVGLVMLGFFGPDLFVKNATDKRSDSIRKALPDALDLMVICAEAGLTLDAALNRVSREMANASSELADEFSLTSIELGFLTERRQALLNLADRVKLRAIRGVVATLIQTEKYGTPLAQSLRVLSAEFRNDRMMRAEEKAARLPAIMTVPLILFILPTLFIVLLGPATCRVVDNFIGRF